METPGDTPACYSGEEISKTTEKYIFLYGSWHRVASCLDKILTNPKSHVDKKQTLSHSFILKIWIVKAPEQDTTCNWRGRIIHVMEGRYKYVKTIDEMIHFLIPYFASMGIQIDSEGDPNPG